MARRSPSGDRKPAEELTPSLRTLASVGVFTEPEPGVFALTPLAGAARSAPKPNGLCRTDLHITDGWFADAIPADLPSSSVTRTPAGSTRSARRSSTWPSVTP